MTQTGEEIYRIRKTERRMSRRDFVNQYGDPWTSGRLTDLEQGKRGVRNDEVAAVTDFIGHPIPPEDLIRHGKYAVSVVSEDTQLPGRSLNLPGVHQPPVSTPGAVAAPMASLDDSVIWPVFDDREGHFVLVGPAVPQSAEAMVQAQQPPQRQVTANAAELSRQAVEDAYRVVSFRLRGKPAPYPWPCQQYGPNEVPPSEAPRVLQWCEQVHAYLDKLETEPSAMLPAADSLPVEPATGPQPVDVAPPSESAPEAPIESALPALSTEPTASTDSDPVGVDGLLLDGLRRVTNSEIQTFKHCRRRWWLSWYRGLRLRAEDPVGYKHLGTRVHAALAEWYVPDGEVPTDPRVALNKVLEADEVKLIKAYQNAPGEQLAEKLAAYQKEADLAKAMVEGYVEWLAETGADADYTVIAPEQVVSFVLEISDALSVRLQGRLDVRVQRNNDLVKLFMDHKTVGDFTTPMKTLHLDEQMKYYHLLESENTEEGERVDGAIYNMIRRVKRTATAKPPFYERVELRHNVHSIANFKDRVRGEVLAMTHTEGMLKAGVNHQLVAFPSPSRDCTWKCEFLALCSMLDDGSRAEDFISEHYITVNPLDRYDDQKGVE